MQRLTVFGDFGCFFERVFSATPADTVNYIASSIGEVDMATVLGEYVGALFAKNGISVF